MSARRRLCCSDRARNYMNAPGLGFPPISKWLDVARSIGPNCLNKDHQKGTGNVTTSFRPSEQAMLTLIQASNSVHGAYSSDRADRKA